MFRIGMSAIFAVLCFSSTPLLAQTSADLRFCSGLSSSKERLACYDAAARVEKRDQRRVAVRPAPARLPEQESASALTLPAPQVTPSSRFDGAYVGVTGGYDVPMTSHGATRDQTYNFEYPVVPYDSINGPKLGLLAGYNATSGSLLLGFEARAQYNFNQTTSSATNRAPGPQLPWTTLSMWCGGCSQDSLDNYPLWGPSSYNVFSSTTQTVRLSRPWQTDFALRTGIVFQDWMIFGKAGVGVEAQRTISVSDGSASVICTQPIMERRRPEYSSVQIAVVGCGATSKGAITSTITNSINPTAIFGIGVERNFGNYFARAEAEMTAHLVSGSTYYTPAVNLTAGVRF